ncbi:acetaldehyde dehydrogenase (acetylating) [Gordonia sp. LSe1-13]|uniref:Acetaldehyde dehydrogenase n=1 Tax=Gordonia sesuvii TaxID=3116777 RepID=A0ABU7M985_9ACTN|nr:acetaldehyde dehydrogenase (acetylating) [Gordonia sp. LSe1-13]
MRKTKAAIIGSGNIGTDLLIKIKRIAENIEIAVLVGIDPASDGLARARRLGIDTVDTGVQGLIKHPEFDEIEIIFDSTSAKAHVENEKALRPHGKRLIDLTPAAIGPYVVPAVNLDEHLGEPDVNMVTCGGQATIPIVAAISAITPVHYAEIVASIASKSAGPGTRANIDEFTETTSQAIVQVGGAAHGKAIIILNPADPPLIMRDTVLALVTSPDREVIRASVADMVDKVSGYVPGYRLKQEVQFTELGAGESFRTLTGGADVGSDLWKVSVFLEVEGAAHYLPAYAGNLDIMTSAALQVAERVAESMFATSDVEVAR